MSRGRLNKKHVQRVAVYWLASYYATKANVQEVHAGLETAVSAKNRLGTGRADGLVASLMPDGTVHTAVLEAKSARTLPNIMQSYGGGRWLLHVLVVGLLGIVMTRSLGRFFGDTQLSRWMSPLLAFFAVGFVYLLLTREHARYHLVDVVRQVKRYPANEQWIAVSADAYNELDDALQDAFLTDCRREGFGLLRVRSAGRVTLLEKPRSRTPPEGLSDFLACYARSDLIRRKLHTITGIPLASGDR